MTDEPQTHSKSMLKLASRYDREALQCLHKANNEDVGVIGIETYLAQAATRFAIARGLRDVVMMVGPVVDAEDGRP